MRKTNDKRKFYMLVIILFVLGIGLGYAVLTEKLTISNVLSYDSMKWDVGFDQVIELNSADYNNSLIANTSISSDKKSISLSCDLGSNTSKIDCISRVTIKNNSTFDVVLKSFVENGIDDYEDYIADSYFNWYDIANNTESKVRVGYVLEAGETATLNIKYIFKELTADLLPSKGLEMSFDFEMEWVEDDGTILSPYSIGQEIDLGGEKFNIIDYDDDTITMLAKYPLNGSYIQTDRTPDYVKLSSVGGWEYTPGPKEIDIDTFSPNIKIYLDAYEEYLQVLAWDGTITADLITLKQLGELGCTVSVDYSYLSDATCVNSPYFDWLINEQPWWTKSASSSAQYEAWFVNFDGDLSDYNVSYINTVRPVVTLSIDALENNILPFSIDGVTYESAPPRIWSEWINSEYNVDGYRNSGGEIISPNGDVVYGVDDRDIIIHNHDYRTVYYFDTRVEYADTGECVYAEIFITYANSTWEDFINSEFNAGSFKVNASGYVIYNDRTTDILATSVIEKDFRLQLYI
jgi:hypothetical protein